MPELNNLPCCGPVETAEIKALPHVHGYDFDLHQCLGCGRTWAYAWSPFDERGKWEWVSESAAQEMLAADGDELQAVMRRWAEHLA